MSHAPTFKVSDAESRAQLGKRARDTHALVVVACPVASALGTVVEVERGPAVLRRVVGPEGEDDWMSREHATARLDGGRVLVRDGAGQGSAWRSSANGTWTGDLQLDEDEEIDLAPGELVRTGRTVWMVVVNPAQAPDGSLLIGVSEALGRARDELALVVSQTAMRLARGRRVSQSLLVTGARGTGKQVVAREAHRQLGAARAPAKVPFLQISAPSIADGTVAADLFGVVDRYATDVKGRPGYFEQAHGGVILLDEFGDTPLAEQAKLLNALQERQVTPLGGRKAVPFDALVIAATNRDLEQAAVDGSFREDLVDRVGRFRVHLPPLSERVEDVPFLAQALVARHGLPAPLPWGIVEALVARDWPGNVRELDAFVERMTAIAHVRHKDTLDLEVFAEAAVAVDGLARGAGQPAPGPTRAPAAGPSQRRGSGRRECPPRDELLERLEACDWNKTEVARQYGKHPRQITRWMDYLGIARPD
ncbi:MAG: sigma-54-dependent Fis family transcriptional regulator [Deltaproteobacteria bacterium]|nr:MAG: sigma-54-dependent Fis family transcriptional regulator [Deltaproteobacteria bacterium]